MKIRKNSIGEDAVSFSEQIKLMQEQMQEFDVNELSLENIGTWPLLVKIICWVVIFAGLIFGGYKLVISDLLIDRENAIAREASLKQDFEKKAFQAANLEAYRKQMVEMEESFGALVSQLPSDTEVPGLLEDITSKGLDSGLSFETIDLQPERAREFYIELPIKIVANGTYHDMGAFVSGVASLPRIVTLTDFEINPKGARRDNSNLELKITANTYRYREPEANAKKPGKRRKS